MEKIEERIQEILAEHHECRWMDSSELENCLRRIATEQKAIDIDKACEWLKKYCGMNESGLVQFRKAMEE